MSFWRKKNFFLIWIKSVKSNSQLGEIRPPTALLDYPLALLSNKDALLLKRGYLFHKQFDSILHFKQTISQFLLKIFLYLLKKFVMKNFITNQTSTFLRFHELHEFSFLEVYIYVHNATSLIFDWKRKTSNSAWFCYLLNDYLTFSFRFF